MMMRLMMMMMMMMMMMVTVSFLHQLSSSSLAFISSV